MEMILARMRPGPGNLIPGRLVLAVQSQCHLLHRCTNLSAMSSQISAREGTPQHDCAALGLLRTARSIGRRVRCRPACRSGITGLLPSRGIWAFECASPCSVLAVPLVFTVCLPRARSPAQVACAFFRGDAGWEPSFPCPSTSTAGAKPWRLPFFLLFPFSNFEHLEGFCGVCSHFLLPEGSETNDSNCTRKPFSSCNSNHPLGCVGGDGKWSCWGDGAQAEPSKKSPSPAVFLLLW